MKSTLMAILSLKMILSDYPFVKGKGGSTHDEIKALYDTN